MRLRITGELDSEFPEAWGIADPISAVRDAVEAALLEFGDVDTLTVEEVPHA